MYYKPVGFGQWPKEELVQLSEMVKPSFEHENLVFYRLHDLLRGSSPKRDSLTIGNVDNIELRREKGFFAM